jgi:hypothetical protein
MGLGINRGELPKDSGILVAASATRIPESSRQLQQLSEVMQSCGSQYWIVGGFMAPPQLGRLVMVTPEA